MDLKVGDIAVVDRNHDHKASEMLLYVTSVADETVTGYLRPGGFRVPTKIPYTCPISAVSRAGRALFFKEEA